MVCIIQINLLLLPSVLLRIILAAIIAAMCLASCSVPEYRRELKEADSIASVDPERAMTMLDSMRPAITDAPEHEQMYYRLLRIKAQDKAYIEHKSDSAILPLVEYYETKGDKRLLSEAYYYAGNTYRDMNDAPRALEYYKKAERALPNDATLRERSRLQNQQGVLFLMQGIHDAAIIRFRNAYEYEAQKGDTAMMAYCMNNIAYTFSEKKDMDSSLFYYNKAYALAKQQKDQRVSLNILGQIASLYTRKNDYTTAYKYIKEALSNIDASNISAFYSIASNIYINTEKPDSAFFYCKELLDVGTVYAKKNACWILTEIYLSKRDVDNAAKYLKMFKVLTDSVDRITVAESVAKINSLYNYNLREQENLTLKAKNSKILSLIIIIISVLCIIISIFVVYVFRNKQRQKMQAERLKRLKKEMFEQSEEYIRNNNIKIEELKQELKVVSDRNKELIDRLEEQRADLLLANETAARKKARSESTRVRLEATDIYGTIQNNIKRDRVITGNEWKLLDETINREIENFRDNLFSYYRISEHEYHICLLIRIGISPKDMANLLGCTASAVSKARKRLQEKFFGDRGTAKDFDAFVNSL